MLSADVCEITLPLDFLKQNADYFMTEVLEGSKPLLEIELNKKNVCSRDRVVLKLKKGGGYIAKIEGL